VHQIDNIIQTSGEFGMNLMEASLASLVNRGVIEKKIAMEYASRPAVLNRLVSGS